MQFQMVGIKTILLFYSKSCLGENTFDCLSCYSSLLFNILSENKGECVCVNNLIYNES